jgi:hypothetical protein
MLDDLIQKSAVNVLARMIRDNGRAPIRMLIKHMAPLLALEFKTKFIENFSDFLCGQKRNFHDEASTSIC